MSQPTTTPATLPGLPRLPPAMPRSGVSAEARLALRQILDDLDRSISGAFHDGADAGELIGLRARAIAKIVVHVWQSCVGETGDCALFAVGGFGRGLLFPHSDVDLLVLVQPATAQRQARAIEAFLTCLWDLGVKPGHAVRSPAECRAIAAVDVSVFTSLLDARLLAGGTALVPELDAIVEDASIWPARDFFAAKRAEQAARHARYNDTTYNLEPNLKEGPGGLRTLDLMRWLGRRIAGAADLATMVEHDLLDATERAALERSEATLWRYRLALHLAAGRPEERLLFDHQRQLAAQLGYEDEHAKNLAVEQFMQGYYRAATIVERLGAQLTERYTELLEPTDAEPVDLDADFIAIGPRLELRDPNLFLARPRAMVDVFATLLDHPQLRGLSSQTMRLLQQSLAHYRDEFADDSTVLAAFLDLLRRGAAGVDALARMNRHGVLAAILPMFRRVVGRMQYDLFHVYTVDEHTLRVLRNMARFADPAARGELPIASATFAALDKPELLLLAGLFHDIAKGRGGDHSVLGEEDTRAFGEKLGLPSDDIDLIAWLVRWHLLMSVTAQRQDITDPDVVHRFAIQVEDMDRLDNLYLLTIADIAGTNPKLWNEWKARLLADLYVAARYALRAGLNRPPNEEARVRSCRARTFALLVDGGIEAAVADNLLSGFPDTSFLRHRAEQVAWQARSLAARADATDVVVAIQARSTRGGSSELFVCAPDRDGLFAAITATLDRLGLDVVDARLLASDRGIVFDSFELLDAATLAALDPARAAELQAGLTRTLASADLQSRVVRRAMSRRLRHFQRTPQIGFSEVDGATQLALVCADQRGLLAQVAQALREARVRVHDARIATFGERAEDFFILTDEDDHLLTESTQAHLCEILLRSVGRSEPVSPEQPHVIV